MGVFEIVVMLFSLVGAAVYAEAPPALVSKAGLSMTPSGLISMTSIQDALLPSRDAPLMTKNTFAVGNNVVITKSNIIIRKEGGNAIEGGSNEPRMSSLSRALEHMIVGFKAGDRSNATSDILDLLAIPPTSSSFDKVRNQVTALFTVQDDRKALRKRIADLLDDVDALSYEESMDSGSSSDSESSSDSDSKQKLLGYRTLFRYSAGTKTYYGWRYPLPFWAIYGPRGAGTCGFGHVIGDFFYC